MSNNCRCLFSFLLTDRLFRIILTKDVSTLTLNYFLVVISDWILPCKRYWESSGVRSSSELTLNIQRGGGGGNLSG